MDYERFEEEGRFQSFFEIFWRKSAKNNLLGISFYKKGLYLGILMLFTFYQTSYSASGNRVHYANRDIFISGLNVAWVSFAGDLGPTAVDTASFKTIFRTVHSYGGNVMRFWLHTNGAQTPVFNANGYVTGPGTVAIANLKTILDMAKANDIGLILCLWSHDMLNTSELNSIELNRNAKLLTDTSYTNTYIRNALIPMVNAVKGHPAIGSWEIFNEPEGLTNEFGWSTTNHVPMASVQQFINLTAGAIHHTDPNALVTSGAVTFQTLTDVTPSATSSTSDLQKLSSMSSTEKQELANTFNAHHRTNLTANEYVAHLQAVAVSSNYNYYKDDRLIAVGGDSLGTLDFYCVHYYTGDGTQFSPFLHPASYWGLTKPIVAAEFHMTATDGVGDLNLYPNLYANGYSGAMMWSYTDFSMTNSEVDTWTTLKYMYVNYHDDIEANPVTGTIYTFAARSNTIEKTDSTYLRWDVEPGSTVKLNGTIVAVKDGMKVNPLITTSYTLTTSGTVNDTAMIVLTVLPSGKIVSFTAFPSIIGTGEILFYNGMLLKGPLSHSMQVPCKLSVR